MLTTFTSHGWEDYTYWQQTDLDIVAKINELINEIHRTPFKGKGKPEALKGNLKGFWSRRISGEHRLVYRASGKDDAQSVLIIQARFHYE